MMKDTKEKIVLVALELFATDGYAGVSMSMIASEIGITKAALYKHYTNKQDIFDSIVAWMQEKNKAHAKKFDVPIGSFENTSEIKKAAVLKKIKTFSLEMFKYWTEDTLASNFRKMLTLEQYRNPEMANLLNGYLTGGIADFAKDLISEASNSDQNADVLALEYFAPIYMMMNLYDQMDNKEHASDMVEKHIDYFMASISGDHSNE